MAIVQLSDLGAVIKTAYEGQPNTGDFNDADRLKLNGIATNATANDTDANLKNRANHTGVQPMSSVSGLDAALAAISGGTYRPEDFLGVKGAGVTGAQRVTNASAISQAFASADANNGKASLGGGIWEVEGTITVGGADYVIDGAGGKITQFAALANVLTMTSAVNVSIYNVELDYSANQTTGDAPTTTTYHAAIKMTGTSRNCALTAIKLNRAWVGVGMSGTNTGHKLENVYSILSASNSYPLVLNAARNVAIVNGDLTGNGSDIACAGAVLAINCTGCSFDHLRVDRLVSAKPILLSGSKNINFESLRLEGVTPTQVSAYAALVHLEADSSLTATNMVVDGVKLNKTTGSVDFANVFAGGAGATGGGSVRVRGMLVTNTSETGAVRFGLIGSQSSAAAINTYGEFEGVRLDTATATPHRLDDLCFATLDVASTAKNGIIRRYNQTIGDAIGSYVSWGDVAPTLFLEVHGPWQRFATPLTANRTAVLSNRIEDTYGSGPLSSPLVPRGARMKISRTTGATGAFSLSVANHNGTVIGTLSLGQTGDFVFDGVDWSGYGRGTF
jgi:hypothetical protein